MRHALLHSDSLGHMILYFFSYCTRLSQMWGYESYRGYLKSTQTLQHIAINSADKHFIPIIPKLALLEE
jgi:hypothetical protein